MTIGLRTQLPTLAEMRAMSLAFRRRSDSALGGVRRRETEPDGQLLDLLGDPFESVADVRERLGATETHLRERSDRRSVFLTVYTRMTANVEEGIGSGLFDDPGWVRAYLVAFADRYRVALVDWERGALDAVPEAWKVAFHASTRGETVLVQDALLGMNAHINYDLTYTLRDVGIDPNRSSKHRDHDRINEVLERLVDVVQRALVDIYGAGGYAAVDDLLGSFDEEFTLVGLTEARSLAWRNAVGLTDTRSRRIRRFVDWRIRVVSTGAGYFLLAPSAEPTVLRALRDVEDDDPPLAGLEAAFRRRLEEKTLGVD